MTSAEPPEDPVPPEDAGARAAEQRLNVRVGAVVVAVILGILGFSLLRGRGSSPPLTGALRSSLERDGCTVDSRADPGRKHIPVATYSVDPPAGGDHDATPSPAGFYYQADVPTDGHLVHSLEHGFVIVWYRPETVSAATVDGLRDLARRSKWVLVAPRPSMPTDVAATAWKRRLLCPDGTTGPIDTFVNTYRNRGPEKGFV